MERFGLDEIQAQAILDMRLKALQGLDREKLEKEFHELEEKIAYFQRILADNTLVKQILKEELLAIAEKFGDDRRTEIQDVEDEIDIEDLIEEEECVYTLTQNGYIKRTAASEYSAQKRGGKGVKAMTTREEDVVTAVFTASTHDFILFFTNTGKVHRKKGYLIPEAGRAAKGTNIVNILPLQENEKVTVNKDKGTFLSLIPLDYELSGVTLSGVKYPLENARIFRSKTLTISNEITADLAEISVKNGSALVIVSRD